MSEHDEDGEGSDCPEDPAETSIGRFALALDKVVGYHVTEYDLPAATVIGVLVLETFRRITDAIEQGDSDGDEDQDEEAEE